MFCVESVLLKKGTLSVVICAFEAYEVLMREQEARASKRIFYISAVSFFSFRRKLTQT